MTSFDDEMPAIPCGKIARSFFTDTFVLKRNKSKEEVDDLLIRISDKGIAWHQDREKMYKNIYKNMNDTAYKF